MREAQDGIRLPCHPIPCRMRFDHPDDHPDDRSVSVWAVWTDKASNVSSLDPSRAIQSDAEHPTRNRKVELESLLAGRGQVQLPTSLRWR
jgi:hypothetical protein